MLFKSDIDPELQPRRTPTLVISIAIHLLLVAVVAMNPDFLQSTPKRIIRIAGQDYDLSQTQLTELTMPPAPNQSKQPEQPMVQPPVPAEPTPPPPPPPPPPQQAQMPPVTISPEDVLKEGARPDAQPRASRGDTAEMARAGSPAPEPPKPEPAPPKAAEKGPEQMAQNINPNALRLPNLKDSLGRVMTESAEEQRRKYMQGGRTGLPGQNTTPDPNFSTEEPTILSDTRGYDFGPYMNQVLNRIRINWYTFIPEVARPPFNRQGRVVLIFTITQNGGVQDLRVVANSGLDPLDRAAIGSITASNPFPRLPSGFDGDHLTLQITYLYNYR